MFLVSSSGPLCAQPIPDAATPGGVLPERPVRTPSRDPLEGREPLTPSRDDAAPAADAGPRFPVQRIVVEGVVDRPESDLDVADVEALVEAFLADRTHTTVAELGQLVGRVTDHYRARGLVLTRAYLPEQDVDDGEVTIRVIEGVIGELLVEGNQRYRARTIGAYFDPLLGVPTSRDRLESALLYTTDLPGIESSAVLQRGARPGTADLVYRVGGEDRFDGYFNLDNFGSEFVGENRARLDVVANNPARRGDRLTVSGLSSFSPSNSEYYGFDYAVPRVAANGRPVYLGLSGSHNEFEVGGELAELELSGESSRLDFYSAYPYRRSRFDNGTLTLTLSLKQAETFRREAETSEDELSIFELAHVFSHQNQALAGGIASIRASFSHGVGDFLGSMAADNAPDSSRQGASGERAGGEFDKFNLNASWFQRLGRRVAVNLRVDGQASDDLLVSLEQFPLGGPNSVRAYPLSSFLVDEGWFASLELSLALARAVQLSVFYDHGSGSLNDPLPSDVAEVDLSGAGVGLRVDLSDRFTLVATVARPTGDLPPGLENEEDENRVFVSMSGKIF